MTPPKPVLPRWRTLTRWRLRNGSRGTWVGMRLWRKRQPRNHDARLRRAPEWSGILARKRVCDIRSTLRSGEF